MAVFRICHKKLEALIVMVQVATVKTIVIVLKILIVLTEISFLGRLIFLG